MRDYTEITEQPGMLLSADQIHRFAQRYALAADMATNQRVLELACGAGGGLALIQQTAQAVVGLDCTWSVLTQARAAATVPLTQADAEHIPFAAASFDLLICFEALYYLDDYAGFLRECRRVLAPGGRILLCESNPEWHAFAPGELSTRYPRAAELVAALEQAGYREIKLHGAIPAPPGVGRAALINRVRRLLIRTGIAHHLRRWAPQLMRVGYGQLYPLPAALDRGLARIWSDGMTLTPLARGEVDRIHRVIFAQGVA